MKKKLSEQELMHNQELVYALLQRLPDNQRRPLEAMLEDVSEFFTAPASSREDFHSCYVGGLAEHTLGVVKTLITLADTLCPDRYTVAQLIVVGLLHDFGKAGDGKRAYYIPTSRDWKVMRGELYDINHDLDFMTVPQRSLFLAQRWGVELGSEEYRAILLSDGQYVQENKVYGMKEPSLALLLHFADLWRTQEEKRA